MAMATTDEFLAALTECGLLTPTQLGTLARWARDAAAEPIALAKELDRLALLTQFQIREVYRGRGAGLVLGKYVLLDLVGEGGMGRVYRARDTRLDRQVALKVIRKDRLSNPQTIRRFHQEIQAVSHLNHPNVVLAFDADEVAGHHFCAMEFVDGTDLTKLVKARGPLPVHEACDYVRQAALGLQHAHERGMVHRDIKPSNLIASPAGQVKVLDMGLALLNEATETGENRLTQVGFVIGTPDFLAPEQAQDPLAVDARADVYALGCTLFYLLTGRTPYEGANSTEKLIKHVTDPVPSLLPLRPGVPPQLDAVVRWTMAKRPKDRPQTTQQVAAGLLPFCTPGGVPQPVSAAPQPLSNSAVFHLPVAEAPARVRERDVRRVSAAPWFVTAVAVVALVVAGYLLIAVADPSSSPLPAAYTVDRIGLKMVRLDGGSFVMGSPEDEPGRSLDEGPAGEVVLTGPFFVSATEVTNGQFTRVVGRSPAVLAAQAATRDVPVDSVTWPEAVEFCRKLSELEAARRPGWAYRLPTEAEWEYACRAGSPGPFAHGDRLSAGRQACFTPGPDDALADGELPRPPTRPGRVGQTEPNRFELFDLHGNVWEWCNDYYARAYPPGPRANPTGPAAGDLRVIRGGAFDQPAAKSRSAARKGLAPGAREPNVGFRVVFAAVGDK